MNFKKRQIMSTVLAGCSVVGLVATTITAIRATPKALEKIKKDSAVKHGDQYAYTKIEALKSGAIYFVPTALMGTATIVCIVGGHYFNKKTQASIASAYTLVNQTYAQYRAAAKQVYGEDADAEIQAYIAKKVWVSGESGLTAEVLYNPDDDASDRMLFYDNYSKRYFESTFAAIINAQYHVNRNIQLRGHVPVNEFYTFLGIDPIEDGDNIGWDVEDIAAGGYYWLDFFNHKMTLDDGLECCIISAIYNPGLLDYDF